MDVGKGEFVPAWTVQCMGWEMVVGEWFCMGEAVGRMVQEADQAWEGGGGPKLDPNSCSWPYRCYMGHSDLHL